MLSNDKNKIDQLNWFENSSIAVKSIVEVVNSVKDRDIRLPLYQRDSVWGEGRICALWDSLLRGFPLPSFFLAKGKGDSRGMAVDGNRSVTKLDEATYFDLLDGQQRLTSIYNGFYPNSNLHLWIDLAPPRDEKDKEKVKLHPHNFTYWIHPCTKVFPFGFHMVSNGEHNFQNLSDGEIREIQKDNHGKELFEISLDNSFPWFAKCPVRLSELVNLISDSNIEKEKLKSDIKKCVKNVKINQHEPDEDVVKQVAEGLIRLKNCKLALQETTANEDHFTLFERIGRGGIPISQRQLAVSHIMLEMGKDANDAVAEFKKSKWYSVLDTEEIIHAVTRIFHFNAAPLPENICTKEEWSKLQKLDVFELDLNKIKELKKNKENWDSLVEKMKRSAENLNKSFDVVFSDILCRGEHNKEGFSLVQLAQAVGKGGGIHPITLHPLFYWSFCIRREGEEIDQELRKNFLQWIIFSNGITNNAKHKKLNQLAFYQIAKDQKFDFKKILEQVFSDNFTNDDQSEIGFVWNDYPVLDGDKKEIVNQVITKKCIPTPKEIVERTLRRLVLQNWADKSGVNRFLLLWNQREMLDSLYGSTEPEHISALYGKGCPVDADHIVARDLLSGHKISMAKDAAKLAAKCFLSEACKDKIKVKLGNDVFRKNLPNLNGNYRFWPKALNRADQNCFVIQKLPKDKILKKSKGYRYHQNFQDGVDSIGWDWSAIENKDDWEALPPHDTDTKGKLSVKKNWGHSDVVRVITAILKREHALYANAYNYLLDAKEVGSINLENLIDDPEVAVVN